MARSRVVRMSSSVDDGLARDARRMRGGRLVLAAVGVWDRRALLAAARAASLRSEWRAVHVAVDDEAARELGLAWMNAPFGDVGLDILDDAGGVAATVVGAAAGHAETYDEVVVVVGQLVMGRVLRRLLHDDTALSVAQAVAAIPRATTVVVPVPLAR
jgi:hypothetical protein